MSNKITGAKYDSSLSRKEISKLVKTEILEKFPNINVSVKIESYTGGGSVNVVLKDIGFKPFTPLYCDLINKKITEREYHDEDRSNSSEKSTHPKP